MRRDIIRMDERLYITSITRCDECGSEITEYYVMENIMATDDIRSNGKQAEEYAESKICCIDCAFDLFESSGGEWQAV